MGVGARGQFRHLGLCRNEPWEIAAEQCVLAAVRLALLRDETRKHDVVARDAAEFGHRDSDRKALVGGCDRLDVGTRDALEDHEQHIGLRITKSNHGLAVEVWHELFIEVWRGFSVHRRLDGIANGNASSQPRDVLCHEVGLAPSERLGRFGPQCQRRHRQRAGDHEGWQPHTCTRAQSRPAETQCREQRAGQQPGLSGGERRSAQKGGVGEVARVAERHVCAVCTHVLVVAVAEQYKHAGHGGNSERCGRVREQTAQVARARRQLLPEKQNRS